MKPRWAENLLDGGRSALRPIGREAILAQLEKLTLLDAPADLIQSSLRKVLPNQSAAKHALSGTWLGHPVHPPLTDVVIGSWTSSLLLDIVGGKSSRRASDVLLRAGVVAALPTAAAGASDWADIGGGTRRVGLVHAAGNTTALTLQILSLRARRRGDRARGAGLSALAMGVATFSAWLGGHLSFGLGVGVNQTAFEDLPTSWTPLIDESELDAGEPVRRSARGAGVMLVRHHGKVHALSDRCSHRGCSLAEGRVHERTITCRCHGSTFALDDGAVVTGPATAPQPTLEVRMREGKVEVRQSSATS